MSTISFGDRLANTRSVSLRCRDFWLLAKPRILVVALGSVAVGYAAALPAMLWDGRFALRLVAIACVAYSCGLLNQSLEFDADVGMSRTSDRPLASGRLTKRSVWLVGWATGIVGVVGCWLTANTLTMSASLLVLVSYVGLYTPLKRVSFAGTVAGAVSGALPPLLGWFAAGGGLTAAALWLFLFVFAWQFPHFLAIATVYRSDYESVGYRMLPTGREGRSLAGVVAVAYAAGVIPVCFLLGVEGLIGKTASVVAVLAAVSYLGCSVAFWWSDSITHSRRLLLMSLVFLTYVFGAIACHQVVLAV